MSGFIYLGALLVFGYGLATAIGYPLPPQATAAVPGFLIMIGAFVLWGLAQIVDRLGRAIDQLAAARAEAQSFRTLMEGRYVEMAGHLGKLERRSETYEGVAMRVAEAIEQEQRTGEAAFRMTVDAAVTQATAGMQPADRKMLYRGREVTLHADGGVTAPTALGLRRFASLSALDDYIQA
ncbi:hypothetical protein ABB55_19995 [Prosthecomicrobium hirschii]|uniref:Uncharacterized protein n=1 Tax=Prosthecodimorpha hirschii TaxID=665126 RepID=A0A0P6VTK8_9HYPH|nr:hypothetical protein [Prosthecomicrobium hirschii]KPL54216.1 hypothetical protein ABB55_19995 [Prosthecomicrobium hirschii]